LNIRDRIKEFRRIKASDLRPNPKNWRKHPQAQHDALRGILAEVGYVDALMARQLPDGSLMLVDGHLRAETTPDSEVPVLIVDLTEEKAAKVLATFDPLGAMAEADSKALDALLREVNTSSEAVAAMLEDLAHGAGCEWAKPAEIVEDEVPEPPVDPVTKPGDLWLLGEHRLLCGDSTKGEDVGRAIGGQLADMVFTDPPYNVAVAGGTHDSRDKKNFGKGPKIQNDSMNDGDFRKFLRDAFGRMYCVVKPGAAVYVSHADTEGINFRCAFLEAGFLLKQCLVWVKQQFVFGRSDYHWQHEPILYGWRDGAGHQFFGERNQGTTWTIDRPMRSEKEHPTQKPVALPAKAIRNSSKGMDILFEPFAGAGSTIIAAEQLGRRCYGLEIEPRYCDVVVQRWEKLTGKKAEVQHA
jgi:DNA modification methylase